MTINCSELLENNLDILHEVIGRLSKEFEIYLIIQVQEDTNDSVLNEIKSKFRSLIEERLVFDHVFTKINIRELYFVQK